MSTIWRAAASCDEVMSVQVLDSLIEVPGGRVFVRRWGDLTARAPLVLLHDSLGSIEQWRNFPHLLSQDTGRQVLAYDRLGFGRSTPRSDRPSVDFIREEASTFFPALARSLGLARFVLFGHSVGGAMALVIAATHEAACEAVVTEAAQAFVEPRTLAGIRAAQALFADPAQFERLSKWHDGKARWVLDAWTQVWLSAEFSGWSLEPYLPAVTCPVLVIHGDRDDYGSEEFPRRIARGVSGPAEMAILAEGGHVPHRERREEVLRLTAAFLERYAPHEPAAARHAAGLSPFPHGEAT
jgi:pimeloyl-ACP methyl ester carboxylesterase